MDEWHQVFDWRQQPYVVSISLDGSSQREVARMGAGHVRVLFARACCQLLDGQLHLACAAVGVHPDGGRHLVEPKGTVVEAEVHVMMLDDAGTTLRIPA
jgi:hypothetical protein